METLLPEIRNAARAVIVRDNSILLLRKFDEATGERYSLPGGGQDVNETLEQSLVRECEEEIGVIVGDIRLLHVAEFYKQKTINPVTVRHTVDFVFACTVPEGYQAQNGPSPDKRQTGVHWMPLDQLEGVNLSPWYVKDLLKTLGQQNTPFYLGNRNVNTAP